METRVILLVEDNPDDVALTLRALKRANIANDVVIAEDGEKALEYLFASGSFAGRNTSIQPAVVLLDLKLPRVDGLAVLKQMRADERTRLLPVVILTCSREERDLMEGYSLGANAYMRKPVDFIQFSEAIQQLGLFWLVLNEPPPTRRK